MCCKFTKVLINPTDCGLRDVTGDPSALLTYSVSDRSLQLAEQMHNVTALKY